MRLIRLVSPTPAPGSTQLSEFENFFNDNILIKKGSKLALSSCTIPINVRSITIDDTNDTLQYKVTNAANPYQIVLDHGKYEALELLQALTGKAWGHLRIADFRADIGFLVDFSTITEEDNNMAVSINTYRQRQVAMSSAAEDGTLVNIAIAGNSMTKQNAGVDNTAWFYSKIPFIPSCGWFRSIATTVSNFIFALTNNFDGSPASVLNDAAVQYAIKCDGNVGTNYQIIDYQTPAGNNHWLDTGVASQNNDMVAIEIEQGKLYYRIYNGPNNDTLVPLGSPNGYAWDKFNTYHHCVGLRNQTVVMTVPNCFYDPRYKQLNGIITLERQPQNVYNDTVVNVNDPNILAPRPPQNPSTYIFTLNFTKAGLRRILSFSSNQLKYKGLSYAFEADAPFGFLTYPSNLLCELLSLPIDSYDGVINSRRNILGIIQNLTIKGMKLLYTAQFPIFMDLNTSGDISLRSLRVRITERDDPAEDELFEVDDVIELSILIDG